VTEYFLNFWIWWYAVKSKQFLFKVIATITFLLEYSSTLPMARNLTVPLFQDSTGIGKLISFFIRGLWVWVGGIICVLIAIPLLAAVVVFAALPLVIIFQVVSGFIRILV
jgi:hypothetical protein